MRLKNTNSLSSSLIKEKKRDGGETVRSTEARSVKKQIPIKSFVFPKDAAQLNYTARNLEAMPVPIVENAPRRVKNLMRLHGRRISRGLRVARASGFGHSIHRSGRRLSERESRSLDLGGSVPHENEKRSLRAPVGAMLRQTRSVSTGTLPLRIDATFPNWHSNSDSVGVTSPAGFQPLPGSW